MGLASCHYTSLIGLSQNAFQLTAFTLCSMGLTGTWSAGHSFGFYGLDR
jgi:hypothetical protein